MKYRAMAVITAAFAVAVSVVAPLLHADANHRYHQHTDAPKKQVCDCGGDFCTHLPLVVIDTAGADIPGKAVLDKYGNVTGYTAADDGGTAVAADISIIDNDGAYNHASDTPSVHSAASIRVRGNSSRAFDKPGYFFRLLDENGENNPQQVMGMDAHSEWALHGPYLDKSLMRNYMWYNIAGEIMDYAPNVRFCEAVVNGEYMGLYVMVETITAGKNGARLNLSVDKKNNSFTGYCLRLDHKEASAADVEREMNLIDTFSSYTFQTPQQLEIVYPGRANLTEQIADGINSDFSAFEKALYSFDYKDGKYGYRNYVDVDSFVNYFLINEFTCNYDAGWLSTYIYKDVGGAYKMCVWDFNSSCDCYKTSHTDPQSFEMHYTLWLQMMVKDEKFTDALIRRYRELRDTYFNEDYLNSYIDGVILYLGDAIGRNYDKWGYTFGEDYDLMIPTERNPRNYDEAISQLKGFIHERGAWMDDNIESLLQMSAESKNRKFNEHMD